MSARVTRHRRRPIGKRKLAAGPDAAIDGRCQSDHHALELPSHHRQRAPKGWPRVSPVDRYLPGHAAERC